MESSAAGGDISKTSLSSTSCPHQHFYGPPANRDQLTPEQYVALLATPRGYRWAGDLPPKFTGPKTFSLLKPARKTKHDDLKGIEGADKRYMQQFISQILPLMSPEMINRLKRMLVMEFGMRPVDAEKFIRTLNSKNKSVNDNASNEVNLSVKAHWLKEFERLLTAKITDYIVSLMCVKRSKRAETIAENLLCHICDLTGERSGLEDPQNRVQRIQVFLADRLAAWLENKVGDADKTLCKAFQKGTLEEKDDEKKKKKKKPKKVRIQETSQEKKKKKELEEQQKVEETDEVKEDKEKLKKEELQKNEEDMQKEEEERQEREKDEEEQKNEEERKKKDEEEWQKEEERKKNEAEKRQKEEEQLKEEEENRRKEEEEIRRKEEEENRRKEEEEKRRKEEEENRRKEEERIKKEEEERIKKEEEERIKKEEKERIKKEEEERIKKEEEERLKEEERRKKKEEELLREEERLKEDVQKNKQEEFDEQPTEGGQPQEEHDKDTKTELADASETAAAGDLVSSVNPMELVKEFIEETDEIEDETDEQQAVTKIMESELKNSMGEVLPEEEARIKEASKKVSAYVDKLMTEAKKQLLESKKMDTTTKPKYKQKAFYIKKVRKGCHINVRQITTKQACNQTRIARTKKVEMAPESICKQPQNAEKPIQNVTEIKEWTAWATEVVNFAENWWSWIYKKTTEEKAKIDGSKKEGKEFEKDLEEFRRETEQDALELQRNKKYVKETSEKWTKKIKEFKVRTD